MTPKLTSLLYNSLPTGIKSLIFSPVNSPTSPKDSSCDFMSENSSLFNIRVKALYFASVPPVSIATLSRKSLI